MSNEPEVSPTLDSILQMAGKVGKIFSLVTSMYSSIKTSEFREEVLDDLNTLLAGQKELESQVSQVLQLLETQEIFKYLALDPILGVETTLQESLRRNDNYEYFLSQTFNQNYSRLTFIQDCGSALERLYFYLAYDPAKGRPQDTSVNGPADIAANSLLRQSLWDLLLSTLRVNPVPLTSICESLFVATSVYMTYPARVFRLMCVTLYSPQSKYPFNADDKNSAELVYNDQFKWWFSGDSPRCLEVMNSVYATFNNLQDFDLWFGAAAYDSSKQHNDSKLATDIVRADPDKVVIGWELYRVPLDSGDHAIGVRIYQGALRVEGWVDPAGAVTSSSNSTIFETNSFGGTNLNGTIRPQWVGSANVPFGSHPKAWSKLEILMPPLSRFKVTDKELGVQQGVLYWAISGVGIGPVLKAAVDTYYICLSVTIKPIIAVYSEYYEALNYFLGSEIAGHVITNERQGVDYSNIIIQANDPQYDTGGPSGNGSLTSPISNIRLENLGDAHHPKNVSAHCRLDLHRWVAGGRIDRAVPTCIDLPDDTYVADSVFEFQYPDYATRGSNPAAYTTAEVREAVDVIVQKILQQRPI